MALKLFTNVLIDLLALSVLIDQAFWLITFCPPCALGETFSDNWNKLSSLFVCKSLCFYRKTQKWRFLFKNTICMVQQLHNQMDFFFKVAVSTQWGNGERAHGSIVLNWALNWEGLQYLLQRFFLITLRGFFTSQVNQQFHCELIPRGEKDTHD